MDAKATQPDQIPSLDRLIGRLHCLTLKELRDLWRDELGSEAPPIRSPDFIRRLLAWRLQERASGGLDRHVARQLSDLGRAYAKDARRTPSPKLKPGTVLGRRWKGIRHDVTVTREGYLYDGDNFAYLSEVARHITGTRWNGPRFFGLRRPTSDSMRGAPNGE